MADAAIAAAAGPGAAGAVLNVGSGTGVLARTLVTELVAISGYDGPVHEDSGGSPRSAGLPGSKADIGRARARPGLAAPPRPAGVAGRPVGGVPCPGAA